jgi:hypothetical protein
MTIALDKLLEDEESLRMALCGLVVTQPTSSQLQKSVENPPPNLQSEGEPDSG